MRKVKHKALYGLLDSAKLWNDEFTNTLTQDGYIQNEYDACVFNKVVDEVQVSVYVHVDDLMVTSKNEDLIKDLHRVLQSKYGTMQLNLGKVHSFLGMTFDFTEDGKVKIKMDKFIKELLEKEANFFSNPDIVMSGCVFCEVFRKNLEQQ